MITVQFFNFLYVQIRLQNSRFFSQNQLRNRESYAHEAHEPHTPIGLALCFQPRSSPICLTARAYLNTQKYGLFCSLCTNTSSSTFFAWNLMFALKVWKSSMTLPRTESRRNVLNGRFRFSRWAFFLLLRTRSDSPASEHAKYARKHNKLHQQKWSWWQRYIFFRFQPDE